MSFGGGGGERVVLSLILSVGALLALLYLQPVRLRARVDVGWVHSLHVELEIWRKRFAFDGALERQEQGLTVVIRRRRGKPGNEARASLGDLRRMIAFVQKRPRCRARLRAALKLSELELSARVGTGDAAYTALLYGLCRAWMTALAVRLRAGGVHPAVRVLPDYRRPVFLWGADCIITFRIGDIMAVAWLALWEGWMDRWNGIRSKV